jgi:uncharacterized membrane protein
LKRSKHISNPKYFQNPISSISGLFWIFILLFNRIDFQAQVPDWVPLSKNLVVLLSGIVEIALGLIYYSGKATSEFWMALAIFFILVFPGNLAQYLDGKDALEL